MDTSMIPDLTALLMKFRNVNDVDTDHAHRKDA
jgi:hypothetical protein